MVSLFTFTFLFKCIFEEILEKLETQSLSCIHHTKYNRYENVQMECGELQFQPSIDSV